MSIVSGGLVFKRERNLKRPAFAAPPPPGMLIWYIGDSGVPVPPETVSGPALDECDLWIADTGFNSPETFETFFPSQAMDGETLSSNGNAFTCTSPDPGNFEVLLNGNGRFNTTAGGDNHLDCSSSGCTFTLGADVCAFGCYVTDVGDFGRTWTLTATKLSGGTISQTLPGDVNGALVFIGFVDYSGEQYTQVEFTASAGGSVDAVGFDDIQVLTRAQLGI